MKYSDYRKTLKLKQVGIEYIDITKIKCQYNPDYEKKWISICGLSYNINSTPYYEYLSTKKDFKYRKLMEAYGRHESWIDQNINKFNSLTKAIKSEILIPEYIPQVLISPTIKNKYNDSYEIWEGHRRLSICLFKRIKQKVRLCEII